VPPEHIAAVWPAIEAGVVRALETARGEATAADVRAGLEAGRSQLMLFTEGAEAFGIIFQILQFPRFKFARIGLAFGRGMSNMREAFEQAELWAANQGCAHVEAWVATKARARLFARFGYDDRPYVIIRKDLSNAKNPIPE
jgi:hypothetical protein